MGNSLRLIARIVAVTGECVVQHRVGDEMIIDGFAIEGRVCLDIAQTLLLYGTAMHLGANLPWLEDPDIFEFACGDHGKVRVQVRRVARDED